VKSLSLLIHSNIFISLAAVALGFQTQIQLGMRPQFHPYLFIIFFATLLEYNLHRLISILLKKESLHQNKNTWLKTHLKEFYFITGFSFLGFILAAFLAKAAVLLSLIPFAGITLFYSLPVFKNRNLLFRLREIPGLKIFLIAFVWSAATIILPVVFSPYTYEKSHLTFLFIERFIFVFAITIPFDIRDMKADLLAGLKTIPLWLKEKKSIRLANISILIFALLSAFHYYSIGMFFLIPAYLISAITTLSFLNHKSWKDMEYYHYGILDGSLLLQSFLVFVMYFLNIQSL
jgi:4-hydroxybenzoate polyprenyltransferase